MTDTSSTRAFADLAAEGAGGVAGMIRDTHRAIAARAFGASGPGAAPVRVVHDGVSSLVYGAVRAGLAGAVRAGGVVAAARGVSLESSPRGRMLLGAVNGAWGDRLAASGSPLALRMEFAGAMPASPGPRLAVFVHGLCETDEAWLLGRERSEPYPSRMASELGYTPLLLRYNMGRHISENGRELASLLCALVESWPVEVEEIVFVGHSMGGLVARSACHFGSSDGAAWVKRVRHVFSLGSPFNGADLEKAANVATWALDAVPETRALAGALKRRSAGIKDLRYGSLTDDCWEGRDADELLRDHRCDIPWLEHAQHTFISAHLFTDPDHPIGSLMGDLLVRRPSAWAGGLHGADREEFLVDASHAVGPANHMTLLNHPDVYARIREQLAAGRPALLAAG